MEFWLFENNRGAGCGIEALDNYRENLRDAKSNICEKHFLMSGGADNDFIHLTML